MAMELDFKCSDGGAWKDALSSYESRIESLNKPDLVSLDQFYRLKLPSLIHDRDPNPYLTTSELSQLMKWKLSRGKWRKAMEVALGNSKGYYSLKQYLLFVTKLQDKAKELKLKGKWEGPSDIERALWSCTVRAKSLTEKSSSGEKRKRWETKLCKFV